jgi:hypothetical protein
MPDRRDRKQIVDDMGRISESLVTDVRESLKAARKEENARCIWMLQRSKDKLAMLLMLSREAIESEIPF